MADGGDAKAAAFERFSELMWGLVGTQCLHVVASLGVADALAGGPRPVADVAREVGADPDALQRILRWLTSAGVFTQPEPGVAGLTAVGELLVDGHPATTRYNALFFGGLTYRTWAGAVETARTGRPAFAEIFGAPFFDYLAAHPEDAETFNRAMQGGSAARLRSSSPVTGGAWAPSSTSAAGTGRRCARCSRPTRTCAALSTTSRTWPSRRAGRSTPRASRAAARRSVEASSTACPRAATSTSWPRSCTIGTTTTRRASWPASATRCATTRFCWCSS